MPSVTAICRAVMPYIPAIATARACAPGSWPRARRSPAALSRATASRSGVSVTAVSRAGRSAGSTGAEARARRQADGPRRYQYNPRLQEIMRDIPKGTIYDRNGLPLATSNWAELEKHRAEYRQLGIDIDGRWGVARLQHEIAQARQR